MGFGQAPGPPASAKQVKDLLALLIEAGHRDFRDARGAMGLTQRQAGGKFTRTEADDLIERLMGDSDAAPVPRREPVTATERRQAEQIQALGEMPSELLAGELQRRGWVVMEP